MSSNTENLWPANLVDEPGDRAPLLVLREQAELLRALTSDVLNAQVTADPLPDSTALLLTFKLVAPALGGYEYLLFRVRQPMELYPVDIEWEGSKYRADDETGFKLYLSNILSSARVRRAVSSLLAQSKHAGE